MDGEAGLADVGLGGVFGFLEELEGFRVEVDFEDVAGCAVEGGWSFGDGCRGEAGEEEDILEELHEGRNTIFVGMRTF